MSELDAKLRSDLSRFLPADLLNQLPERQAMRRAIQHLGSLYISVSSFLPQYIVENEESLGRDYGDLRPGTFMFADVSGFTALSEQLQKAGGSEGVEILTAVINDYFSAMLEIIAKSDGQLLKFAGDALLVFFPEQQTERMDEAEKAIRTGLRMQRSMIERFQPIRYPALKELFGEGHNLELTMSIGISTGKLFEALVGNSSQRDHLIQGTLPGMAQDAEEVGIQDDVIIDRELCERFQDKFRMREMDEGFFQVIDDLGDDLGDVEWNVPRRRRATAGALYNLVDTDPVDELRQQLAKLQTIACYVASEVVNKLAIRVDAIEAENRPATVIFSHVSGFAEMLEAWGDDQKERVVVILSRFYTIVQRIIASYGGVLTRTDPYKSGFKMLITFGAPVAYPDDRLRAVRTAVEIRRQVDLLNERLLDELPLRYHRTPFIQQRFGITHGTVFAGEAGFRQRREYTVMGDDVNLAARLMGKAEFGEIWMSGRVQYQADSAFECEALPPLMLKGKMLAVQAYRLLKPRTHVSTSEITLNADKPFIGHDLLMLSLGSMLKRAATQNIRGAVALTGDAGVGKTRTAQQLAMTAADTYGFKVAWTECQVQNDARENWAKLFAQLLDIEHLQSAEARREKFDAEIERLNLSGSRAVLTDLMLSYLGGLAGGATTGSKRATDEVRPQSTEEKPKRSIFDIAGLATTPAKVVNNSETETKEFAPPTGLFRMVNQHLTPPEGIQIGRKGNNRIWEDVAKKTRLDDAIIAFLRAYTAQQPTMLIIDDIHDMDPYTLEIMETVVRTLTDAPLIIIGTTEPNFELPKDLPQMALTDLPEDETRVLAMKLLKASEMGEKLESFIWSRTSGRPFYIESIVDDLRVNNQVENNQGFVELAAGVDPDALPDSVRELIVSRVDRLSAEKQDILKMGAVLDMPFTHEMIKRLNRREHDENLQRDLHQLNQTQLLERHKDGTYTFRHGVTQDTMYESLSRYLRQKMHRTIAEYWEAEDFNDRYVMLVAHHHAKAGALMRAIEIISTAAQRAEEAGNLERALELYTRSKEIIPNDDTITQNIERIRSLREQV